MSNQPPTVKLRTLVERAIDLRARGYTWDQVAKRLQQKIEDIRDWPNQFPEFWARRLAIAHRELDGETIGEARAILRHHLRTDNVMEARDIARVLFDHARGSQTPPAETEPAPPNHEQIADHLEGLSHDELRTYIDTQLDRLTGDGADDRDGPEEC
jgi:hypothetical protein